ncbi:MAG: thioredoxin family protein [Candidatus Omnitrophica bacterium]|nr:thioredoxin family protein [Candidatus Omnitrophota bacterium]
MASKILVYSTPTCPHCIRLKQFLSENKVDFINYDVSVDREKADEMIKKSGQMGVPVTDIDGQLVIGFDKEQIKSVLGLT